MVKENFSTLMETFMMVFGTLTSRVSSAFTKMLKAVDMRAHGKTINNTAKAMKPGLMVQATRVSIKEV